MVLQDWILVLVFIFMITCLLVEADWQAKVMTALGAELLFGLFYFISYTISRVL